MATWQKYQSSELVSLGHRPPTRLSLLLIDRCLLVPDSGLWLCDVCAACLLHFDVGKSLGLIVQHNIMLCVYIVR